MAIPIQAMQALMQNPDALSQVLASTGARPPSAAGVMSNIGAGPTGMNALGTPAMQPAPQQPAPTPAGADPRIAALSTALAGAAPPAAAAQGAVQAPSAPGAALPPSGFKPGASELMQLLMAGQQKPVTPPSLGAAILGR